MITPSFNLTATERVLPKLALDFTTASLDSRITFTRTTGVSNPATYTNASGAIVAASNNQPRFDYASGVCKGLLIEESRTNLALNSILDGAVTGTPGTSPTSWVTAQNTGAISAIAASNYADGYEIEITCAAQRRTCVQTFTVSANTSYAFSIDVYITSSSSSTIVSDFADIAFGPTGATTSFFVNGAAQASNYSLSIGTQYRITCVMAVSSTAGNATARWGVGLGNSRTTVAKFRNAQVEAGAFATSYVPTTTAALTRNADVATITGSNFSDFWQATHGGALVFATPSTVSGIRTLVQFDDNTVNEIIALRGNTTNPELYIVDGGTPQAQLDAGTIAANTAYALTGWWATNDCKARKDAGAVVTDTTATIPTVTQARIGSDGTNYLNGTIATIGYYDSFFGRPIYTRRKNKVFPSLL